MRKTYFLFIFIGLFMYSVPSFSQSMDDATEDSTILNGITVENFPVMDGSDSTEPLRRILACKLLGFDYEWVKEDPFLQDPNDGPKTIKIHYTCTKEQEKHLEYECLLRNNTHPSFVNLIDDSVELILTARSISRDEKVYAEEHGVELIEKPIAKDALTFIINPTNPVNNLTIQQIQGIYTGEIVNWNEVGGSDALITPYVRNRNSGSEEKFETMVMTGLTIKDFPEMQIGTTMMSPYYKIEEDETGIAFTPFYYYKVIVDTESTKAIGINGVEMNKENIQNGTYPYVTDVYAAVRSDIDKSSMAYKIFDFLTTTGGQAIVDESGYVSLTTFSSGIRKTEVIEPRVSYANGSLYVQSSVRPTAIQIISLDGKTILQQSMNTNNIPLHNIGHGSYIVKVTFADKTECTSKILW
jgi:phosphate transport system substrate-binding protein